jgi:hypothetical protein
MTKTVDLTRKFVDMASFHTTTSPSRDELIAAVIVGGSGVLVIMANAGVSFANYFVSKGAADTVKKAADAATLNAKIAREKFSFEKEEAAKKNNDDKTNDNESDDELMSGSRNDIQKGTYSGRTYKKEDKTNDNESDDESMSGSGNDIKMEYIAHEHRRRRASQDLHCWSVMSMPFHFYGSTTDLYTKALERTSIHEKSVKAFHGGGEYVAILYGNPRTQFYGDIPVRPTYPIRSQESASPRRVATIRIQLRPGSRIDIQTF